MIREFQVLHNMPGKRGTWQLTTDNVAIDVVKTRIQIDSAYKGFSLLTGAKYVVKNEGRSGLLTGFGPTAIGYLVQVRLSITHHGTQSISTMTHDMCRIIGRCEVCWVRILEETVRRDRRRPRDSCQVPHCNIPRIVNCSRVRVPSFPFR